MKKFLAMLLAATLASMPMALAANSQSGCYSTDDANVILNMNGNDGGTTFTDNIGVHSWTATNQANTDQGVTKFGNASLQTDGAGDYISTGDHADWDFGTGDYTIDFWANPRVAPSSDYLIEVGRGGGGGSGKGVAIVAASTSVIIYHNGSGIKTENNTWTTGTWKYYRVTRASGSVHLYVNGSEVGSGTAASQDVSGSTEGVEIGGSPLVSGFSFDGNIDDVRIIKGYAIPNGTAPTAEMAECVEGGVLVVCTTE